jgi:hypothetical protein
MVTTVPLNSSAASSLGMAVISLDLSSTLRWASTRLLALAQAETMHQCLLAYFTVPHSAFPSIATTSPAVSLEIEPTQATKLFSNSAGSSRRRLG